jgi:hypothetical protein
MSIGAAAAFLRFVRSDDEFARRLAEPGAAITYDILCAAGREAGFSFEPAERATSTTM